MIETTEAKLFLINLAVCVMLFALGFIFFFISDAIAERLDKAKTYRTSVILKIPCFIFKLLTIISILAMAVNLMLALIYFVSDNGYEVTSYTKLEGDYTALYKEGKSYAVGQDGEVIKILKLSPISASSLAKPSNILDIEDGFYTEINITRRLFTILPKCIIGKDTEFVQKETYNNVYVIVDKEGLLELKQTQATESK